MVWCEDGSCNRKSDANRHTPTHTIVESAKGCAQSIGMGLRSPMRDKLLSQQGAITFPFRRLRTGLDLSRSAILRLTQSLIEAVESDSRP